jgi:predicted aspartyl protease
MGRIYQNLTLRAFYTKKVRALIDTGADATIIRPDIAKAIYGNVPFAYNKPIGLTLPDGRNYEAKVIALTIIIKNSHLNANAAIFPIKEPLLIGNDFLQENRGFIIMDKERIKFNKYAPKIRRVYRI